MYCGGTVAFCSVGLRGGMVVFRVAWRYGNVLFCAVAYRSGYVLYGIVLFYSVILY